MNTNEDREFEDLLNLMVDGELTKEQQAELEAHINKNESNRQFYQDFCRLQGTLESNSGQLSRELLTTAYKSKRSLIPQIVYAVAALIVLTFIVSKLNEPSSIITVERGESLAKIDRNIFADFAYGGKGGKALKEGDDVPSGEYFLKNGIVKMKYDNGATVILESPCRYELINDKSMRLMSGKASIHSPNNVNYKVYCPGVVVEDLGTEFSVDHKEYESLDVHVFKGVVKVETTEETSSDKTILKTGEAIRVIYNNENELKFSGIDYRSDLFIRQLESPNAKYAKEIVKMNPVLYYPMDVQENGVLVDYSLYKNNGESRGVKEQNHFFKQGKFGPAIRIGGANSGSHIFVKDYPKTKDSQITGMAWVKAKSRPKWATIMKNWVDSKKGQFHFGLDEFGYLDIEILPEDDSFYDSPELQNRDDVYLHGKSIHMRESVKFPIGTWQHVAFVHDGNFLYLYRNGKIVTSLKTPEINYPAETKILSIGTKLRKDLVSHSNWKSHWDGMLDEITIFNRALSPKEIEYVYKQVYSDAMVE